MSRDVIGAVYRGEEGQNIVDDILSKINMHTTQRYKGDKDYTKKVKGKIKAKKCTIVAVAKAKGLYTPRLILFLLVESFSAWLSLVCCTKTSNNHVFGWINGATKPLSWPG